MLRKLLLPVLVVVVACNDSPAGPSPILRPTIDVPDPYFETVIGTVVSEHELFSEDGRSIPLLGGQTPLLRELIGADIRILGTADEIGATALWIVEFRVLRVDGLPALDGMLEMGEVGFAVWSPDGYVTEVPAAPEDLMQHVGKRVWMTTRDGYCVRYGILEEESEG